MESRKILFFEHEAGGLEKDPLSKNIVQLEETIYGNHVWLI